VKKLVADIAPEQCRAQERVLKKLVRTEVRRKVRYYLRVEWYLDERRSCALAGISPSGVRYRGRRSADEELREELRQLEAAGGGSGTGVCTFLLKRESEVVKHKRVCWPCGKQGCPSASDEGNRWHERLGFPDAPDQLWSLDFA